MANITHGYFFFKRRSKSKIWGKMFNPTEKQQKSLTVEMTRVVCFLPSLKYALGNILLQP